MLRLLHLIVWAPCHFIDVDFADLSREGAYQHTFSSTATASALGPASAIASGSADAVPKKLALSGLAHGLDNDGAAAAQGASQGSAQETALLLTRMSQHCNRSQAAHEC